MANTTLTIPAVQEICAGMAGLKGSRARQQAQHYADFYGVSIHRIYDVSRAVRPRRDERADKGKRAARLLEHEALRGVAELVNNQRLKTDLAIATVRVNPDVFGELPRLSEGTIQRYLREHGLSRTQRKQARKAHRSFEAEFPMHIFQYDDSGVKERWVDPKTLRILRVPDTEVSFNHPNRRCDRVRLWKMGGCDDYSRYRIVEYVAAPSITSTHYINYLRKVVCKLGLMHVLYTDNASVLTSKRIRRGADILNKMFEESGGFRLLQHAPENPQATGKVERGHQIVEEYERLVGVKIEYGDKPTLSDLNRFAHWFCNHPSHGTNCKIHRVTGQQPRLRLRAGVRPIRLITEEQFDAAFKSLELTVPLRADVCVIINKVKYQLPRAAEYPFVHLAVLKGVQLDVVWMDGADFFVVITPDGAEYSIEKTPAKLDVAGEYKQLPETNHERNRKLVKESAKERKKQLTEAGKKLVIPGFDTEIEADGLTVMPRRSETGDDQVLDSLTHNIRGIERAGRPLDIYDAIELLQAEEIFSVPPRADDRAWLQTVFAERETIFESELHDALKQRVQQPQQQPKPSRAHLRVA